NKMQSEFRWWDQIDQYLLLGAVPFPKDVPRLKELGVGGVITLNEPYETLVPTGRSTIIVLCYMVEYKHMTPDSALEYVRSRRPRVLLAPSQWKAVQEFKDWRLTSTVPPSPSRDVVLITKADLEGYSSPSHSKELAIVSSSHVS
ncbi:putative dual specificity protein phosphatase DSP8, partial [Tanacetum coccineum]